MIRQEGQEIAAVKTVLMVMLLIVRGLRPALSVNRLGQYPNSSTRLRTTVRANSCYQII